MTTKSQRPNATTAGNNPDVNLWCAVISQALDDATMPVCHSRSAADRHEAREWLTSGEPDFLKACTAAGLDPDAVRAHAIKAIAAADHREVHGELHRARPKPSVNCNTGSRTLITFGNETLPLSQWAQRTGINAHTIKTRLNQGWSVERALTAPARHRHRPILDRVAA